MIRIPGFDVNTLISQYPHHSIESYILDILYRSNAVYNYDNENQLRFELSYRKSLVETSHELYESNLSFKVFKKSTCNPHFWQRTNEGGFLLKDGVNASDAITDIFRNSSLYGTECSTAMVIVYLKALLNIFPEDLFNRLFPYIYLMDWQNLDNHLGINEYGRVSDYLPGDGRYFINPDVDPLTPEWQGENVFDLGNGLFYGHGLGILNAERIIHALNKRRVEGSTTSAHLLGSAKRPDFRHLAHIVDGV